MRFTESLKPTPQKYNKENQTIETTVKGRSTRLYPVPHTLAKILESLEPLSADEMDTPYYSLLHKRHRPQKNVATLQKNLRWNWYALRDSAGVKNDLRAHDLRRTAATNIHRITGDVLAAQQLLGHADLSTTAAYLKPLEPERMRELIEQLDTR